MSEIKEDAWKGQMTGDLNGPSPRYTCAFCGLGVTDHVLNPIKMVAHALEECRERLRAQRDEEKRNRETAVKDMLKAWSALHLLHFTSPEFDVFSSRLKESKESLRKALGALGIEPM